ncbi:MAG: putative DNA-binding domain-containing protein [Deltaproteobacteria bacterium]|nr:putative DNA-binding domain-containing protein [Deltaproteobacteria bacterium]
MSRRAPPRSPRGRAIVGSDGGPTPSSGGLRESLGTERASAQPPARVAPRSLLDARAAGEVGPPVQGPLSSMQRWFAEVVMHGGTADAGVAHARGLQLELGALATEQLIRSDPRLSAAERLGIYHYAYRARLIECLADDYPAVEHALGEQGFETLARRYIDRYPSRGPNLNHFGRSLAELAEGQDGWLPNHRFIADLARLEWAMVEVLHASLGAPLALAALEAIPPERWADVRLTPSPALRFLTFRHPVNAYLQCFRTDQATRIPSAEWSATAVYRQGFTIWRMDFTRPMAAVLDALLREAPLGEAMEHLDGADPKLEGDVRVWFREWVSGGFFAALRLD